jgi:hypothetical protein
MILCIITLIAAATAASAGGPAKPPADDSDDWNRMLVALLQGDMGPNDGWFKPSQTRYDWTWVQEHLDPARRGAVPARNAGLPAARFDRLDRDGDGMLTRIDFDWSDNTVLAQKHMMARMFLMRADGDSDNKLSQEEWNAVFKKITKGGDHLDVDVLRKTLFPAMPPRPKGGGDFPSATTLLQGFYRGELGSPHPGPRLGDFAPDFTLPKHDGAGKVSLRSFRAHKPVVLIFGSFT